MGQWTEIIFRATHLSDKPKRIRTFDKEQLPRTRTQFLEHVLSCSYMNLLLGLGSKKCPDVENVRTFGDKECSVCSFVRNLLSSIGNNFLILSYSPFSLFLLARAASADRSFRNFANLIIIQFFRSNSLAPIKFTLFTALKSY